MNLRFLSRSPLGACDTLGRRVRVVGRAVVDNQGSIMVGDDVVVDAGAAPVVLSAAPGATLVIGARTVLGFGVRLAARTRIQIGEGVRLAPHVTVADAPGEVNGRAGISIGDGATVGAGARITAGATIPAGAVIQAGAVVGEGEPARRSPAADAPQPGLAPASPSRANGAGPDHAAPAGREPVDASAPVTEPRHCRGVVLADFTADDLAVALQVSDGFPLEVACHVAPLGQVVQTLDALVRDGDARPDFAFVWTRPEEAIPAFRATLRGERVTADDLRADVAAFASALASRASAARFLFVATWATTPDQRGLGMRDLGEGGVAAALSRMNVSLADALAGVPNVFLLDAQRWLAVGGLAAVRPKLWFLGKIAYGPEVLAEAARDVRAALRGVLGMARKLLVLDLDDTLWGGIVGDVGYEQLRLGGHDGPGEAFVAFQHQLLALARRGVALAVVSKNEESVALDAMRRHPEMVVRPEHLAAYRINWRDKAQNIVEIARELNLGLQSVVFIDDNPVERGRVREALPEVHVPDWPADPMLYPLALNQLRGFDTPHVSQEDVERNAMFAVERQRVALRTEVASLDDWLGSLGLRVRFEPLSSANLLRATQLLNKTNQMNLRTRRLSDAELRAWAAQPGHECWAVHVADRFGDSGLTGLLGLRQDGAHMHVEDLVLSCRVMGRHVEETLVWAAVERARRAGAAELLLEPIPTAKNKPCRDYLAHLPLHAAASESPRYTWCTADAFPCPSHVAVDGIAVDGIGA